MCEEISERDRKLAALCAGCPLCRRARLQQRGLAYWLVRRVEGHICPACKAYEKVHGRPAHAPDAD